MQRVHIMQSEQPTKARLLVDNVT